jgi:chromosome segregation ATPase
VIGGKLDTAEATVKDLRKELEDAESKVTDAVDARMKVEGQLSELLRKSGDRDQHEKQQAMLKADRDARAAEARAAAEARDAAEQQLARIRGTYDDIVHERDELKARVDSLESEMRVAASGNQLRGDWEARYKSASEELNDLKKIVSRLRLDLLQAKEAAARGTPGGAPTVDAALLELAGSRAELHETLVLQMLEGVNNAVSLLRRNSELLKGYVEDCGLLANAVRKIDYTRLEREQQQMLVELVDQTQPDVIVKNMQGIGEENAESIVKAKKLILDYSDAFKREEAVVEVEAALAKAQGLLHATDPNADVPVKIEAVLPAVDAGKEEAVLFCFALLREAKALSPEEGGPASVNVNTDGLTVTFTVSPVDAKAKERYREPPDAQSRLVRGFAQERCGGKAEYKEEDGKRALVVTLKAKI